MSRSKVSLDAKVALTYHPALYTLARRMLTFVLTIVLLQPLPQDPPPHAKCKDKFLVQSAFISPDEEMRTLAEMVCSSLRRG